MDRLLLSLAAVLLSAAFVVRRHKAAIALAVVGGGLFLYLGVRVLWPDNVAPPRYELTSARDASGGHWFKLKAEDELGERPVECACTVTSFSGELDWRLNEDALMQRQGAWGPGEIIMKWPDDFKGSRRAPPPGRYELACNTLAANEDGSIVQVGPMEIEFDHE